MVIANPNIWPSVDQRHLPATYKYDAFGRRIEKVDSKASKTRRYYYDDRQRVLEEYDNAGTPARQAYFVWGTYVDELLLVNDDAADDADYYACRDHLYSVHVLYNPTTGIAERYDYDAYGQPTIYTADGGDSDWWDGDESTEIDRLVVESDYTFTGRRYDMFMDDGIAFDIMYYRARYYSTNTGRFISRDPAGYVDGMSLYEYVRSGPLSGLDFLGLQGSLVNVKTKCWTVRGPSYFLGNYEWETPGSWSPWSCTAIFNIPVFEGVHGWVPWIPGISITIPVYACTRCRDTIGYKLNKVFYTKYCRDYCQGMSIPGSKRKVKTFHKMEKGERVLRTETQHGSKWGKNGKIVLNSGWSPWIRSYSEPEDPGPGPGPNGNQDNNGLLGEHRCGNEPDLPEESPPPSRSPGAHSGGGTMGWSSS